MTSSCLELATQLRLVWRRLHVPGPRFGSLWHEKQLLLLGACPPLRVLMCELRRSQDRQTPFAFPLVEVWRPPAPDHRLWFVYHGFPKLFGAAGHEMFVGVLVDAG